MTAEAAPRAAVPTHRRVRTVHCRVLVLFALATASCSPELNWRELRSEQGRFVAILPGTPHFDEREITGERGVVMHLWSAKARGAVFGIGYADYPAGKTALVERARDTLAANIRGRIVEDEELSQGTARGRGFRAEGPDWVVSARLLMSGTRLYQIAVLSKKGNVKPPDIELFLSSFRLVSDNADKRM